MGQAISVNEQTFEREVLQAELPVLVDFWADWCGPCRMVAPVVEEVAREYAGRLKVVEVDVDENLNVANRYGIRSIPTLAFFVGGQPSGRFSGYVPKGELVRRVEEILRVESAGVSPWAGLLHRRRAGRFRSGALPNPH